MAIFPLNATLCQMLSMNYCSFCWLTLHCSVMSTNIFCTDYGSVGLHKITVTDPKRREGCCTRKVARNFMMNYFFKLIFKNCVLGPCLAAFQLSPCNLVCLCLCPLQTLHISHLYVAHIFSLASRY